MTPMSIVFFAAISLLLLIPCYQSADCSKRPSLIAIKADNTTDFTDSITAAYNSWNSSVRLGFNSAFTQIRNIIYTNTTYKTPADKINALIAVCQAYNKNNPGAQLVLFKVDINRWCGNVTDFVKCGNATNATASATSTTASVDLCGATTFVATTPLLTTMLATTAAPPTTTLASTSVAPTTVVPTTIAVTTQAPSTAAATTIAPSTAGPTTSLPTSVTPPSTLLPTVLSTVAASTLVPSTASVPTVSTVELTIPSTPALSTSVAATSAVPSSSPVPTTSEVPTLLTLPSTPVELTSVPPTTLAITLSTLLASTVTPTPANECQPQPASTASVIFNTADNQIAKETTPQATCSCTSTLSKAFYQSVSDPNPFGSAIAAITVSCNNINQFCMCTERGECFTQTGGSLQGVSIYPYCQSADCQMYAVVNDALDGTTTMQGDSGTSYASSNQCTDSSCSEFKNFPDSSYLKPVSAGCDGCASLKTATCLGPLTL